MKIHYESKLFLLPILRNYGAIVIGRHCFTQWGPNDMPLSVVTHELIHQAQMDEFGVLKFYWIYLVDYFKNLWRYWNHDRAYREIPFEKEAYLFQGRSLEDYYAAIGYAGRGAKPS